MDRFDFKPRSITDLISTHYFDVPRYQRSYAWEEDHVENFWEDLWKSISEGGDYFLGNIVLTPSNQADRYSIIDGQQRLATTTILHAAIRDQYANNGHPELATTVENQMICVLDAESNEKSNRIKLNEVDNPFFVAKFIDGNEPQSKVESHDLMASAYDFFVKKISDLRHNDPSGWRVEVGKISGFFKKQSRVVAVYAANDADAFTIFETLNDRGRELTIADLLKNYLFSRAGSEIDSVQKNWVDCRAILEEYVEEREFVTFLRHYWSSVHGSTREKDLFKSIKREVNSKAQAVKFSENIREAAKIYGAILSDKSDYWKGYTSLDRNNVQLIARLKLEQHRPLMLAILQHLGKAEVKKILPALIGWSVRGLISGIMGKGAAEATFCDAAVKIRGGKIKGIKELRAHFKTFVPTDRQFQNDFETYRTNNNGLARFLLLAIERGLSGEKQPELVPNDMADEINLEHILPKRAKPADWPKFEIDEITFHSLKLGNMTLLKQRDNSNVGNKSFSVKQPVFAASALKLNKTFKTKKKWEQADIVARQKQLATEAVKIWKL